MSFAKFENWVVIDGYVENSILGFLIESDQVTDMPSSKTIAGIAAELIHENSELLEELDIESDIGDIRVYERTDSDKRFFVEITYGLLN
jgi:hypothetical protein